MKGKARWLACQAVQTAWQYCAANCQAAKQKPTGSKREALRTSACASATVWRLPGSARCTAAARCCTPAACCCAWATLPAICKGSSSQR